MRLEFGRPMTSARLAARRERLASLPAAAAPAGVPTPEAAAPVPALAPLPGRAQAIP